MLGLFKQPPLTQAQKQQWDRDGFLILKSFFKKDKINAVNAEIADILGKKKNYPDATVDVLSGDHGGKLFKIATAPDDALQGRVKLNDLFLDSPLIRACSLDKRLSAIIGNLLDGDPIQCNSLNFIYGSTQPAHYDTWFMPPVVEDKMLATSICLERVTDDNGPVVLYPGTHKIAPYVFPHGGIAKLDASLIPAEQYVAETTSHIEPIPFMGEPGDVLIWHGQVLHGGSPIKDANKTRRSLVSHYFRAQDMPEDTKHQMYKGAYIMKRPHRHVH